MEKHGIKQLPVVKGDALIGILGRRDLLRAFLAGSLEGAATTSDAALSRKIAAELDKQRWAPRGSVVAVVKNRVVDLRGVIGDDRQRAALRIAVENIPGVKEVHDHLVEPEQSA
jgi:osmotically-inducible protein OsmY